jgi:mannose-1-phosphate guanylyltransferase
VSIDYALMEKARNVYVERVDFGWSDLGTWSSLRDNSPRNAQGNVTQGCRVMTYSTSNSIFSETNREKLIVADGLSDFIVADSDDVLLICPIAHEQQIRQYVNDVRQCDGEKYL